MGTIIEETTPTEKSPERKSDESDKDEEKVPEKPNNEQEIEQSSSRVTVLF